MSSRLKDLYGVVGAVGWPENMKYALLGCLAAGHNVLLIGKPGSFKTRFIENLGAALGLRTRIYDVDKLSFEILQGDLNPEYIGQTSKSIDRLVEAVAGMKSGQAVAAKPAGRMFIDSVADYELIGWDEILRGDPASQQALLLNILHGKTFQGRPVKAKQVSCTNTGFDELYEFNEALLNRFHLIFRCPSMRDLPVDTQDKLIDASGHGKKADNIKHDPGFTKLFFSLQELALRPAHQELDRYVKNFMKHLKHPISAALGDRFSGRVADSMAKVLYATLLAYMVVEEISFADLKVNELYDILHETFMATVYLEDLDQSRINQVRNAFFLAFMYTFKIEELTLRDRLQSVPNFLVNCDDFAKHVAVVPEDRQDIGGVAIFTDRLKKECQNDEPRRFILYKWLSEKMKKHSVKLEKDLRDAVESKLSAMEKKLATFTVSNAEIVVESRHLDKDFLDKCRSAVSDKIFTAQDVDTTLFAAVVTAIRCFDESKLSTGDSAEYVTRLYNDYAQLRRI